MTDIYDIIVTLASRDKGKGGGDAPEGAGYVGFSGVAVPLRGAYGENIEQEEE